jgi:hypothetical protein
MHSHCFVCLNGVPVQATDTYVISVLCSWHKTKSHICPNCHLYYGMVDLGKVGDIKKCIPCCIYRPGNWAIVCFEQFSITYRSSPIFGDYIFLLHT